MRKGYEEPPHYTRIDYILFSSCNKRLFFLPGRTESDKSSFLNARLVEINILFKEIGFALHGSGFFTGGGGREREEDPSDWKTLSEWFRWRRKNAFYVMRDAPRGNKFSAFKKLRERFPWGLTTFNISRSSPRSFDEENETVMDRKSIEMLRSPRQLKQQQVKYRQLFLAHPSPRRREILIVPGIDFGGGKKFPTATNSGKTLLTHQIFKRIPFLEESHPT